MKKGDVVQLVIIIMAIVIAITSLQYFIATIISFVYTIALGEYSFGVMSPTIVSLLVTLLYVAICWQLFVKSRTIADFIYEKANIGTSFKIISRPVDLLYVLLIVMGFYYLLQNLPALIKGLVNGFASKAGSRFIPDSYDTPTDWMMVCTKLLLPLVLLMAAKPFANYFAGNVDDEPITIGDDIGANTENDITEP
ncbi:MAG: hypothetical protein V4685_09940 [Bacteroidota bacterium]